MIWNPFRPTRNVSSPKKLDKSSATQLIERLLSVQVALKGVDISGVSSTLKTNRLAAGYVFGLFDAVFQAFGVIDSNDRKAGFDGLRNGYQRVFGIETGLELFDLSIYWQADRDFGIGRNSGGDDFFEFTRNKIPTLGLQRIIVLGFDASMVERTLPKS